MNHSAVTLLAGIFLGVFGALGAWFITKRYPHARFLRVGYALMSAGGALFVIWTLSGALAVGIVAATVMAAGALAGMVGALRRELRITLP